MFIWTELVAVKFNLFKVVLSINICVSQESCSSLYSFKVHDTNLSLGCYRGINRIGVALSLNASLINRGVRKWLISI